MFNTAWLFASRRARTPVTAGHAIDVPLIGACPPGTVETTPTPAPATSRAVPTFENAARKSFESVPDGAATSPDSLDLDGNVPFRPTADTATARSSIAG